MPRPTNKKILLEQIQIEHQNLLDRISLLSEEEITRHHETYGYAIKDVLAHLSAWEQLVVGWYRAGVKGEQPHLPLDGYNWRQIPELNQMFYQRDRQKPLADILRGFHASYAEILAIVQSVDEAEMFTPEIYPWTNKNAMGTYFVSATCSHYVWAIKEIRKVSAAG